METIRFKASLGLRASGVRDLDLNSEPQTADPTVSFEFAVGIRMNQLRS